MVKTHSFRSAESQRYSSSYAENCGEIPRIEPRISSKSHWETFTRMTACLPKRKDLNYFQIQREAFHNYSSQNIYVFTGDMKNRVNLACRPTAVQSVEDEHIPRDLNQSRQGEWKLSKKLLTGVNKNCSSQLCGQW